MDLNVLNEQFGKAGQFVFELGSAGQPQVVVRNDKAEAVIVLQGAHMVHWQPAGEQPVIWLSKDATFKTGKSIRGGVPVCWPWFGPHESDSTFPAHGYARMQPWAVSETSCAKDGSSVISFRLTAAPACDIQWPHATELEMRYSIGSSLKIELITRNTGDSGFMIGEALHTYFNVADVSQIKLHGLDGCDYLDKVDSFKRKQQQGAVTIDQEVDRVYLNTTADCIIEDPLLKRRIVIKKSGSQSTVVWNPWQATAEKMGDLGEQGYLRMLCVETANAVENLVTVDAGQSHSLVAEYSVEAIG